MELDTAYHYCSEIQVSVRIFQWKEKWVIFLLLTNWILSRWHGEKACWTHINNSRRLSNPCNPGVISRSRTHHPPSQVLPKFPYKHCWMEQSIKLISSDFGQVKEMIDKYPKCLRSLWAVFTRQSTNCSVSESLPSALKINIWSYSKQDFINQQFIFIRSFKTLKHCKLSNSNPLTSAGHYTLCPSIVPTFEMKT